MTFFIMPITNWFKRPSFSLVNSQAAEKKEEKESEITNVSSPLTEPTSSFLDQSSPTSDQDADAQLKAALLLSTQDSSKASLKHLVNESFGSTESESISTSQRVVKNGKEIVISSDGEDTDSDCSLEDPGNLFARASHIQNRPPIQMTKVISPKRWKYNLDSLVHDAVDDNEVEASVTRYKAALSQNSSSSNAALIGNRLNESMLITALGDAGAGSQSQRVLGAIRRTNALDYDRTWCFFDHTRTLPPAPEFPKHTCEPGTSMEILRDRDARERLVMSGQFIEMALSKGILSDEVVLWMFHSVPYEPEEELSNAYHRIIKSMEPTRLELLIRRSDVDDLFVRFGATNHALDPSSKIIPTSPHEIPSVPQMTDRGSLILALKLFREITCLLADDTQEHISLLLLRLTLDNSIMADSAVSSELQWTIDTVLDPDSFTQTDPNDLILRVCAPLYNTLQDVCMQSRICHHILPTSPWLAQLRCRLAISFLFKSPRPLTEPLERLLDLKRIIKLLNDDQRFQVRLFQGKADYDWRELIALTALLGFAIDLSALLLNYKGADAENNFNTDIDKLASQIKTIFSSIQVLGASHMTLTLAKGDLEALHYRILYSIRSKPPPKKTLFESHALANGDIRSMFSKYTAKDIGDTEIPIR